MGWEMDVNGEYGHKKWTKMRNGATRVNGDGGQIVEWDLMNNWKMGVNS